MTKAREYRKHARETRIMRIGMADLSPRLRKLERALADIEGGAEPMRLSQPDGFVSGLVVSPELVLQSEWLPLVRGRGRRSGLRQHAARARDHRAGDGASQPLRLGQEVREMLRLELGGGAGAAAPAVRGRGRADIAAEAADGC